ncbi:hypothetical protein OG782_32375 [Streptomyces sp. NBC_00876]|uniref:hypothetical protein n=1 Tax=Streptomyces sp. NBC_00876 TaxID=2975853 RepID=UPI003865ACF0|nr:hypothetical protein OG782_32375 [Streptomyces sp. NBC_00876]
MIKSVGTPEQVEDVITKPYDGCGKCMVAVRRLSRKTEKTNSPAKQAVQVAQAVAAFGGHIVGWADDWEVSGATDPLTRPWFGPWLRGEMGPYDGIAGAAVHRAFSVEQLDCCPSFHVRAAGQWATLSSHKARRRTGTRAWMLKSLPWWIKPVRI